jgi:biotin carboxylase
MLTQDGPRLIEVNGRLVGAKIARLVNYALDFSFHCALIEVHLGHMIEWPPSYENPVYAVTRWITAKTEGFLQSISLPESTDPRIRCVEMLKQPGDFVRPPLENADRIGYIMVCAETRAEAEHLAEEFVRDSTVTLEPLVEQPVASTESLVFDLLKTAA